MKKTLRCLIVDDEPVARKGIAAYVEDTDFLICQATAKNALEADTLLKEETIDLMFLDIQMPKLTGLDFLRGLRQLPMVILTTAYREYALEGYELDVVDYLVKPIAYPRFLKACQKAYETYLLHTSAAKEPNMEEAPKHFFIKSEGKYLKISFDDILYLESLKDYVFIHTEQQRHMVLISLSNATKALPADRFIRVHRSFIVALSKITSLEGNVLKIDEKEIPISKHLREEVFKKLIEGRLWKR